MPKVPTLGKVGRVSWMRTGLSRLIFTCYLEDLIQVEVTVSQIPKLVEIWYDV